KKEPTDEHRLMTGKLEGFLAPCERARPTNSLSWPRPLFLKEQNHETHERRSFSSLCVSLFSILFLRFAVRGLAWAQFNLELPVIRKGIALVAVAAKARIADDEGGLRIKRRMMAPGEAGFAGAMHEGKPNA